MDEIRFDRLARSLARPGSRRALVALAAAMALPSAAGARKRRKCPRGQTSCRSCDGAKYCADLQANAGNCGACGAGCPLNERCAEGRCVCGDSGISAAPYTCCPGPTASICLDANLDGAVMPTDCSVVPSCPAGWTVCTGDQGTGFLLDSCKACCPPGAECDTAGGFCTYPPHGAFPSDARLKTDVRPLAGGLETVSALRPVSWTWAWAWASQGGESCGARREIGLIAQEAREVVPEIVHAGPDGMLSIEYAKLAPALIAAIQEQQARIETLEAEIAALRETGAR